MRLAAFGSIVILLSTTVHAATENSSMPVRRAEAVMLILTQAGIPVEKNAKSRGKYPDVVDGEWYVPYVIKAVEMGLLDSAPSTGLLFPHHAVTRAEFLKMLVITFNLEKNLTFRFQDIPREAWYRSYVGTAEKYGLFRNTLHPLEFRPEERVTHTEAAVAILALFTKKPELKTPTRKPSRRTQLVARPQKTIETSAGPVVEHTGGFIGKIVSGVTPSMVKKSLQIFFQSQEQRLEVTRLELLDLLNRERMKGGTHVLRMNDYLEKAAQLHAKDMFDRGYFSHYSPDGVSYVDRIKSAGYLDVNPDACTCAQVFDVTKATKSGPNFTLTGNEECECNPIYALGENLAKGQLTSSQAVTDWMNSPPHKENVLRKEFDEIGIGLYGDLWVTEFGKVEATTK